MKIGLLTAGGDSPGINAFIKAVHFIGEDENIEIYGIYRGFEGIINNDIRKLNTNIVKDISTLGGTILKTAKFNILKKENYKKIIENFIIKNQLDVIVICGGFDTLKIAATLIKDGFPIISIPQTIDNDINGTDFSLGFFSAVKNIVSSLEIIRSTNQSHERDILVEIMGREAGWLTVFSAINKKVEGFFIPEIPTEIKEIAQTILNWRKKGQKDNIILISEGIKLKEIKRKILPSEIYENEELSGITLKIASMLTKYMEEKPKTVILSYIQRGGTPDIFDIVLATRFAKEVINLIKSKKFGLTIGIKEDKIYNYPIKDAVKQFRMVNKCYIDLAKHMIGN